jgi:hypothetical protein
MRVLSAMAIVVDDAHWADPGSLRILGMLARRIEELPIAMIVATRPADHRCWTRSRTVLPCSTRSPRSSSLRARGRSGSPRPASKG